MRESCKNSKKRFKRPKKLYQKICKNQKLYQKICKAVPLKNAYLKKVGLIQFRVWGLGFGVDREIFRDKKGLTVNGFD